MIRRRATAAARCLAGEPDDLSEALFSPEPDHRLEGEYLQRRSQAAVARIRELRKGVTLGGLTIRELIDEGRR